MLGVKHPLLLAASGLLLGAGCAQYRMGLPGPLDGLGRAPEGRVEGALDEGVAVASDDDGSRRRRQRGGGEDVARAAAGYVGKRKLIADGDRYRYDCSGMVCAVYAKTGRELSGSSRDLHERARQAGVLHHRREPTPGDVAFFDDTFDRNGNGRRDDELTHVAVVESVDDDGTITLVHLGSQGVVRLRMNLSDPHTYRDGAGDVRNDYLRSGRDDGGPRLTGELLRDFGSLWKIPPEIYADDS